MSSGAADSDDDLEPQENETEPTTVLSLIQDEPTRWGSTFMMLSRVLRLKSALMTYDVEFGLTDALSGRFNLQHYSL